MLIVLVILGLAMAVVGLAVPDWRARSALREAGAGLERLLAQARDTALRQQSPVLVRFDPEDRRIGIPALDRWQAVPDGAVPSLTGAAVALGGDAPALLFLGDGSISGGVLTLSRGDHRLADRHRPAGGCAVTRTRREAGFTLVEGLVLTEPAVLAAVGLPSRFA